MPAQDVKNECKISVFHKYKNGSQGNSFHLTPLIVL